MTLSTIGQQDVEPDMLQLNVHFKRIEESKGNQGPASGRKKHEIRFAHKNLDGKISAAGKTIGGFQGQPHNINKRYQENNNFYIITK